MTRAITLATALAVAALIAPGCGGREAGTPKDAAVNLAKAIHSGDEELFLASVNVEDEAAAKAMFRSMSVMMDFMKKFQQAYGKVPQMQMGHSIPTPEEVAEKIQVKEEGDKATATFPDEPEPMKLVKVDGAWKVDLAGQLPQGPNKDRIIEQMEKTAAAVGKVRDKIGTEGYTAQKAMAELMQAMMGARGGMPTPPDMPDMPDMPEVP